jgi:hypothetical protein
MTMTEMISSATTTKAATPPSPPPEFLHRAAWKAGVMGALNVLTVVLACRLILLVSVCGASFLAWMALAQPDPYRLATLGVYGILVVLPMTWLVSRR